MKRLIVNVVATLAVAGFASAANATDRVVMMSIADALSAPEAVSRLNGTTKYYFGPQSVPAVGEELGEFSTNKKANAFMKSDAQVCNWVFLSAMLQLQKRAEQLGADAVVNIVSNYKKSEFASDKEFECHVGGLMAGVALKGDFVKLKH